MGTFGSGGRQNTPANFWQILGRPSYRLAMFDWLRYRYNLARLQRAHRTALIPLREEYQRATEDAKSDDERHKALLAYVAENGRLRDEEAALQSDYLWSVATKRLIPVPEMSGPVLTDEDMRELRAALRAARRECLEIVRSWVGTVATIVTGLTGLIGVIIGLLAFIQGHR